MSKKILRTICFVMIASLMLIMPVSAEEPSVRSSAYIAAYDCALFRGVGAEFHIWFETIGAGDMDVLGVSQIRVQQSPNGTDNWTTVKTFNMEDYTQQMVSYNTYFHNSHVTYYGLSGNYYRAIVTIYASKGNGAGYINDYTQVLYLSPL